MIDPFKNPMPDLRALEELERRQNHINALLRPSAIERYMQQAEMVERLIQPNLIEAKFAQQMQLIRLLDDPVQQAIARHLSSPAYLANIEAGFAAAARTPDSWMLEQLTRDQGYLSAIERAGRGLQAPEQALHAKFSNPLDDVGRLSNFAAKLVQGWDNAPSTQWAADLAARMGGVSTAWALVDAPEASAKAFARLGRLSDVARYSDPYSDEAAAALLLDLGVPTDCSDEPETVEAREERYDEAGRERELIAFPPDGYSDIIISAGAPAVFPPPPPLVVVGGPNEAVSYSPETQRLLVSLEAHMRLHVSERLQADAGPAWLKQRVPHPLREKWREVADMAAARGKPVHDLIHYANFMDLVDIMVRRDNWPLFSGAFRDQGNLRLSMGRLYSVRNDLAHARPIGQTDALIARVESTMLFRAMGFSIE